MSEPKAVAERVDHVIEGVWVWGVSDDRIGGVSSNSAAIEEAPESLVVVNPLRLRQEELDRLGQVVAILLTSSGHSRAAAHFRELSGAAVWAPMQARLAGIEPDETFTEGNELPGGLRVISLPGPSDSECAFYLDRGKGVVIVGDALMNVPEYGGLQILPEQYNPDPAKTRVSLRKLLGYKFETMLFGHGEPIREGARERLRELLEGS